VATVSLSIALNPIVPRSLSLALAAVQTSMLGWLVYRLVNRCRSFEFRYVRRLIVTVLVGCLVLNSTVCLASLLH
jgi:hypothetical protein